MCVRLCVYFAGECAYSLGVLAVCIHRYHWTFFGDFFFGGAAFFFFINASLALSISSDVLLLQSSSGMSKKDWRVRNVTKRDVFFFCVLFFLSIFMAIYGHRLKCSQHILLNVTSLYLV